MAAPSVPALRRTNSYGRAGGFGSFKMGKMPTAASDSISEMVRRAQAEKEAREAEAIRLAAAEEERLKEEARLLAEGRVGELTRTDSKDLTEDEVHEYEGMRSKLKEMNTSTTTNLRNMKLLAQLQHERDQESLDYKRRQAELDRQKDLEHRTQMLTMAASVAVQTHYADVARKIEEERLAMEEEEKKARSKQLIAELTKAMPGSSIDGKGKMMDLPKKAFGSSASATRRTTISASFAAGSDRAHVAQKPPVPLLRKQGTELAKGKKTVDG